MNTHTQVVSNHSTIELYSIAVRSSLNRPLACRATGIAVAIWRTKLLFLYLDSRDLDKLFGIWANGLLKWKSKGHFHSRIVLAAEAIICFHK